MRTVNEVSKLTGVSIRTLQYYDKIGLLKPAEYTESGYRLYDDAAMETLQQILLFRELEFPLKDIKTIITRSDFDKKKALEQQISQTEEETSRLERELADPETWKDPDAAAEITRRYNTLKAETERLYELYEEAEGGL